MSRERYEGSHLARPPEETRSLPAAEPRQRRAASGKTETTAPRERRKDPAPPKRAETPERRKRPDTAERTRTTVRSERRTAPGPAERPEKRKSREPSARAKRVRRREADPAQPRRRRPSRGLVFFIVAVFAALLLGLTARLLLHPVNEGAYEANMEKAEAAFREEDFDGALHYLRRAASFEESDDCLILMAACYERSNKLDKALELLRRVSAENGEVTRQIAELEQLKDQQLTAMTVPVLGLNLAPDTTDLVLDEMELTDADLPELVRLYALDRLSLSENRLSDITPLTQLGGLHDLNLSGNEIRDLGPLKGMTQLRTLYLDRNPLGSLRPLYGLQNLSILSLLGCGVSEDQLQSLAAALPACAILTDIAENDVSDITLGGLTFRSDVQELNLSGRGIRDISALSVCRELRWLNLSDNQISDLTGLMNLPRLGRLDISGNDVGNLRPLMGIETLRSLKAANNAILDTAALSTMSGLQVLDLSYNPITDFSGLSSLKNLTSLSLISTGLNDRGLDCLADLTMLTQLVIDDNPGLSNEAFSRLRSHLRNCNISHSKLVYSIPVGTETVSSNVTELDLSGRGLGSLAGLERLDSLVSVDLSRNALDNVIVFEISSSRESITKLDLSFNRIGDLSPLRGLTALESLSVYGNPLSGTQTLRQMTWLKHLNVGSCGLSEQQLAELREALPGCVIATEAGE